VIALEADRRIQWLHRRVRQKGKFVFGHDAIGRRNAIDGIGVPAIDRNIAGSVGTVRQC
jgi:hypothetical protein